jgi:diguanylate cyclase (GGDEF)-like protein
MPRANMAVTLERAESLREQVMKTQLGIDEIDNEIVTISLGVAIFPQHGKTADELLQAADKAMYLAKRAGRNRVKTADERK